MGVVLSCLKNLSWLPLFRGAEQTPALEAGEIKASSAAVDPKDGWLSRESSSIQKEARPFDIAIVGAGIGGLTLAIACARKNVRFTLYEAAPAFSFVGAGVGFGPNALRAMDLIDPQLRNMYYDISSGNVTPDKNHVAMDALYAEEGFGAAKGWVPAPFGADCYERTSAHRWDLLNILTSLIPQDSVRFNKRVKSIEQNEDRVRIFFEDGGVAEASAVVGSDGVKGPVRRFVLGDKHPDQVKATYSGKYAYRAIVPMKDAVEILGEHAGDAKCFIGRDVNFMTYPISKGTQCNVVACRFAKGPWAHEQWTKTVSREEMRADFLDRTDKRLVKLLEFAEPVQWALHHHLNTPTYCNGRICLLGDSAHATTPHQASGAGQCMEDALILAHVLGQVENETQLAAAFRVYDAIRRPRAQRVVRTSQQLGQIYSFADPDFGEDMAKIVENLNKRFLWIWEHDLQADLDEADVMFSRIVSEA